MKFNSGEDDSKIENHEEPTQKEKGRKKSSVTTSPDKDNNHLHAL